MRVSSAIALVAVSLATFAITGCASDASEGDEQTSEEVTSSEEALQQGGCSMAQIRRARTACSDRHGVAWCIVANPNYPESTMSYLCVDDARAVPNLN